ncbi:MAG: hydantoinase/oxoprolinase family protein, partial [Acidimicrobiia bacterium]|nr:hydantoinase/oxoprolinase family protein [Acidimicrobiia bacterium]
RLPAVGVHTVGAGGGSVAWIDAGGSLRVGPHSAGAVPGPACYGRGGTDPTVTDAHAVLGRLDPGARLGGELSIDSRRAEAAIARLAEPLDMSTRATAEGILDLADEAMARAIRRVTIEQGSDPRGSFLYAFGGAGGLHATALARTLGMVGVVIPPHGGCFSAVGLLLARPAADAAVSVIGLTVDEEVLGATAVTALERATGVLTAAGSAPSHSTFSVDVRYLGQAHEIGVPYRPGDSIEAITDGFHMAHEQRNGYRRTGDPIEVVTVRAVVSSEPALRVEDLAPNTVADARPPSTRSVWMGGIEVTASVVDRRSIGTGHVVDGPAIIEESEATTVVGPGERLECLATGAMEITW